MTRPVPPPARPTVAANAAATVAATPAATPATLAAAEEAMRLRQRAEARYAQMAPPDDGRDAATLPAALQIKLQLHELRVHQIELEMQNEALRQTQVELEVARQRYFELYDLAPVGYFTIGTNGVIVESNLNAAMRLGVAREKMRGESASRFVAFDSQDTFYRFRRECFYAGEPRTCQIQLKRQDGLHFWAHLTANLKADDIGPVMRIAFADINHSQELEKAQARLASIVEESNHAIYSRSLEGEILSWNKGAERMLGYTAAEALGQPFYFGLPVEHRVTWSERVEQVQRGETVSVDMTHLTKHGKPVPVRGSYAPIRDHAGLIVGVSVILQDVSDLKAAQREAAELEARLREAHRSEAMGTRAGGIAHDFNNIVATILNNANLAVQEAADPRKVVDSLHEIRKAGLRARDLVQQFLAFSEHEPTQRVPLLPAGVVEESVQQLRTSPPAAVPQIDVPARLPPANNGTPALPPGRKPRVLYLDDDEAMRVLVERLLERRGLEVVAFGRQRELLEALHAKPDIDFVLTDYHMSSMSGMEVARQVRRIRSDVPVVMTSSVIDENLRAQVAEAGVRELIFKTINPVEYCEAIYRFARSLTVTPGAS